MRKTAFIAIFALLVSPLFAAFSPETSDSLFYHDHAYEIDQEYLLDSLEEAESDSERAQILWRLSRTVLTLTDDIDTKDKKARLAGYGESQRYAEESLALEETAEGYHWQASAIGRIGQVNGPLNSLSKAKPMLELIEKVQNDFNADMSDAWYVLSLLYNQLPGQPMSFGNKNYAISYIRRCVDTQDNENRLNLTNYLELAEQLNKRNWNEKRRCKELDKMAASYASQTVPTEQMKFYEGRDGQNTTVFYSDLTLGEMTDREEAAAVCRYALSVYENADMVFVSDTETADEIIKLLNKLEK